MRTAATRAEAAPESAEPDADANKRKHRPVRSFVLRQGRFTPAQQRAFDQHWASFGIDYQAQPRDLDALFGRHAEHVLEIGFGNGESLAFAAAAQPGRDLIGIEVHRPGVGRALNALADQGISNVRVYCHDAVDILRNEIAAGTLDEVRIFFPDPWHKKRHHKRRLIQPAFAELLVSRLRVGGVLHLATDWADYARQMWEVLDAQPQLKNLAGPGGSVARPPWRPATHFELRGLRLGHGVWDMLYERY